MKLEDARLMALALDISNQLSNPNIPANRAYISAGGDPLDLQLSVSDRVSVLCLALAGYLANDRDYDSALNRVIETIRGNAVALKNKPGVVQTGKRPPYLCRMVFDPFLWSRRHQVAGAISIALGAAIGLFVGFEHSAAALPADIEQGHMFMIWIENPAWYWPWPLMGSVIAGLIFYLIQLVGRPVKTV